LLLFRQLTVIVWSAIRLYTGQFNPSIDLPFDICNMSALVWLPLLLYPRTPSAFLFDGMLFTAFPGTIQAFITPHLYDGFPHITFLKFWIVHGGIIVGVLAAAILNGQRTSRPLWRAILHFHIFMSGSIFFSFLVSGPLNANFTYSRYPPPTGSLLDYFGPWPLYLFVSQLFCYPVFVIDHWICHAFDKPSANGKNLQDKKRN
jgi:hypothetical integral membrane protein (TIGR02206 family)